MSSPGLRERKKQKTRWAIQEHAMFRRTLVFLPRIAG